MNRPTFALPLGTARATLAFMADAPPRFTVAFARSRGPGKGYGPAADPPTEEHTLESLGVELSRLRASVTPKGAGDSLAGCTVAKHTADGWHFRRSDVMHVALTELDHDAQTLPLGAAAEALRAVGVGVVLHPSASADARGLKWRAWVRVSMAVTPTTAAVVTDALKCVRVVLAALVGCAFDPLVARPEALGFIGARLADALGGVQVIPGGVLDALTMRERAIAAGWWTAPGSGGRTYDGGALYDLVVQVGALGRAVAPGVWGLVCPRASEHSDGRGSGDDTSAVLNVNKALVLCSHAHRGEGALTLPGLVAAWRTSGHDLNAVLARVEHPDLVGRVREPFDDEPAADAPPVNLAVVGDVVQDAAREAQRAPLATLVLLRAPLGSGKSRAVRAALVELAPVLPSALDDRPATPRPSGCMVTATRELADEAARGIDALRETLPGFTPYRGGRYLPVHRVVDANGHPVCPHHRAAEALAVAGIDARATLCFRAGTDEPAKPATPGLCPRLKPAGADPCPAANGWHYADGGPVARHAPWIACVPAQGAGAVPAPLEGALLVLDETAGVLADDVHRIDPRALDPDGPAGVFLGLVRGKPGSSERDARWTSRNAIARGVRAVLQAHGMAVLDAPDGGAIEPAEARCARLVERLEEWSLTAPAQGAREAWAALPGKVSVPAAPALAADPDEWADPDLPLPDLPLDGPTLPMTTRALADWANSRPALRCIPPPGALADRAGVSWWAAVAWWLQGCPLLPELAPGRGGAPTGARLVLAPPPALQLARRWHGPQLAMDATGDPKLLAARVGRPVIVRDVVLPDLHPVRRVVVATSRATMTSLVRGDAVRWEGAVAVVRAGLRALETLGQRTSGGVLCPVIVMAPQPLARALAAAGGWALPETAGQAVSARALPPPADLVAKLVRVLPRETLWTWAGGTLARGSNAAFEAGVRNTLSLGDPRVPPQIAEARASWTDRDPRVQGDRDAAAETAQFHGRARHVRAPGPCTAIHVGSLHPWGWAGFEVRDATATDGCTGVSVGVTRADSAHVALRGHPAHKSSSYVHPAPATAHAHAPTPGAVADARARGWSVSGIAFSAGVDRSAVKRWFAGDNHPSPEALARLRAALADAAAGLRETLRALTPRGRSVGYILRTSRSKHGGAGDRLGLRDLAAEGGAPFPAAGVDDELVLWLSPTGAAPRAATLAALEVALPRAQSAGWSAAPEVFASVPAVVPPAPSAPERVPTVVPTRRGLRLVRGVEPSPGAVALFAALASGAFAVNVVPGPTPYGVSSVTFTRPGPGVVGVPAALAAALSLHATEIEAQRSRWHATVG